MVRLTALLAAALLATAARAEAPRAQAPAPSAAAEARATIPVKGMHCGGCVETVSSALRKVDGVKSVHVSLDKEEAVVTYDRARADLKKRAAAIDSTGYKAGAPASN